VAAHLLEKEARLFIQRALRALRGPPHHLRSPRPGSHRNPLRPPPASSSGAQAWWITTPAVLATRQLVAKLAPGTLRDPTSTRRSPRCRLRSRRRISAPSPNRRFPRSDSYTRITTPALALLRRGHARRLPPSAFVLLATALANSGLQQTWASLRSAHAAEACYVGQTRRRTLREPEDSRTPRH